ncbi:B12-binding domain-containing radical SAM protein [bacterium]|nr:B12-binding domain-containing radical SAM protein [bacterium]
MKVMVLIPPSKFAKNVARDLIYGCWCKGKRIAGIQFPPVSQLLVATVLKEAGHTITMLDATSLQMDILSIKKVAKGQDVCIMLTSTMTINEDAEVLVSLKEANPRLITIVYGSHPTFMPQWTVAKEGIDIAVHREPEFLIRDLLSLMEKGREKEAKGITFMENGKPVSNPDYPFIENLDELPIPDRSLLDPNIHYFNPVVKRMPFTTAFTARGCPGKCTYCSSPSFYGRKIRFREAKAVLAELEIIRLQGYREVFFRDEMFTVNKKRTINICEGMLKKGINLTWICSARIGSVDVETMMLMKKAGCHMVRFGVESGNQQILDNIQKGITLGQTRQTFEWMHKIGIDTHAHCMVGMPGETMETIEQTIKFIKEIDPTIATFGICTPYPGTHLFSEVTKAHPELKDGSSLDLSTLHTESFYNEVFTGLSQEELNKAIRKAYRAFYIRPGYLLKWLRRIKSLDELKRVILAGTQVFDFSFAKGK